MPALERRTIPSHISEGSPRFCYTILSVVLDRDTHTCVGNNLRLLLAALDRLGIVEDFVDLLERATLGLNTREPHADVVNEVENQEDRVGLPADLVERNRGAVGVDEAGQTGEKTLDTHALGTDLVVQNLSGVLLRRSVLFCM